MWIQFFRGFTNTRQPLSWISQQELIVGVEGHDKNGIQDFNLPEGYRVGGTQAEIDILKCFFSWIVAACNPSKNIFCDEKGEKMIINIFSISDEAFALLVVLYNKSH